MGNLSITTCVPSGGFASKACFVRFADVLFSIAYSYTTRHLSTSPLSGIGTDTPEFLEARHLLTQLVPFVTERKSITLYSNLTSLVTDMWSRFQPVRSAATPA